MMPGLCREAHLASHAADPKALRALVAAVSRSKLVSPAKSPALPSPSKAHAFASPSKARALDLDKGEDPGPQIPLLTAASSSAGVCGKLSGALPA